MCKFYEFIKQTVFIKRKKKLILLLLKIIFNLIYKNKFFKEKTFLFKNQYGFISAENSINLIGMWHINQRVKNVYLHNIIQI